MQKTKKTERIYVRCTSEQKSLIAQKSEILKMNISDYMLLATEKKTSIYTLDKSLLIELNKIGNNINQIAHYVNTYKSKSYNHIVIEKLDMVINKFDELQNKILSNAE